MISSEKKTKAMNPSSQSNLLLVPETDNPDRSAQKASRRERKEAEEMLSRMESFVAGKHVPNQPLHISLESEGTVKEEIPSPARSGSFYMIWEESAMVGDWTIRDDK